MKTFGFLAEKAMKSLLLTIPLALMSAPAGAHTPGFKCMDAIVPGEPKDFSPKDCPEVSQQTCA
jgi:hypothetical protein